jgi:hypothetical protein
MLLPGFHSFYWMGLTTEDWPKFYWTDQTPYTMNVSWDNWGYYMPQNIREPNNIFKEEFCGGANYSQRNTNLRPAIWGWADTKCSSKNPIMCRKNRGWLLPASLPAAGLLRLLPVCPGVLISYHAQA